MKSIVLGVLQYIKKKQTKSLYVILSGVELSPSEERGESASHKAKRDLVTTLGGFLVGCYICRGKPPKLVRRSLRRFGASVFPRSSLEKTSTSSG